MATREELITLFGDDFGEVLVGLDQLPREVLELLDTTMEKMLFDADVFTSRIAKTVGTQTSAGVATSSIEDILANDMGEEGRIFGELRNTVKESLVEGINQTSRAGAFQAYDPDEDTLFTWVTVAGHRICKDCLPRGGERKTLRDWEAAGVPASGWSICGGYCYCILDPSGKISPRVQLEEREGGLRIQEKGATARPKIVKTKTLPAGEKREKFVKTQKTIETAILNRTKNKIENGTIYDKNGNILAELRGTAANIKINAMDLKRLEGNILTHNLPNSSPFSLSDILVGSKGKALEMRAIAPDSAYGRVTYYIRPKSGKNWASTDKLKALHGKYFTRNYKWQNEIKEGFEKANPKLMKEINKLEKERAKIQKQYRNRVIDRKEYRILSTEYNKNFRKWKKIYEAEGGSYEFKFVAEKMKSFADELGLEFGWETW